MTLLYDYWRSSAGYRVRIALGLAGLDWQTCTVNLLEGEQRHSTHLARNPQGLVPALEIDGVVMTQSLAIIEYLDETRSLGLLPKSAIERAHVRALSYAIAMETHPVCNLRVAKFAVSKANDRLTTQGWMNHFIANGIADFEAMLGQGKYCYGDSVTLADLCLVPQIYNAQRWKVDLTAFPRVRNIMKALEALPAVGAAHPERTPH